MKKLLIASLLVVSSLAYANAIDTHDSQHVPSVTAETLSPCDMPVDCSSLSPLARSVCVLKGLTQGCIFGMCGAACLGTVYLLSKKKQSMRGKLACTGVALTALILGADSLEKSVKNVSAVLAA